MTNPILDEIQAEVNRLEGRVQYAWSLGGIHLQLRNPLGDATFLQTREVHIPLLYDSSRRPRNFCDYVVRRR
jgi:hypothetical protein